MPMKPDPPVTRIRVFIVIIGYNEIEGKRTLSLKVVSERLVSLTKTLSNSPGDATESAPANAKEY